MASKPLPDMGEVFVSRGTNCYDMITPVETVPILFTSACAYNPLPGFVGFVCYID